MKKNLKQKHTIFHKWKSGHFPGLSKLSGQDASYAPADGDEKRILRFYRKISLSAKLNALIALMTVILCALFFVFVLIFYHTAIAKEREQSISASSLRAVDSLNQSARDIIENFIRICSSKEFQKEVASIETHPEDVYMHRQNLEPVINELSRMHYLISSVLIVSGDAPYYNYAPYSAPLRTSLSSVFTEDELSQVSGITWFSERREPSSPANLVVPLVLPIASRYNMTTIVNDNIQYPQILTPAAYVILFLDASRLQASLVNTGLNDYPLSYYLVRGDGMTLTGMRATGTTAASPERFRVLLDQLNAGGLNRLSYVSGSHRLLLYGLDAQNLYLLCDLKQETFSDFILRMGSSLSAALILLLMLMLVVTLFMNRFVSKPVMKLSRIVRRIEDGSYTKQAHFETNDELSQLLEALNSMDSTIHMQKQKIKDEEAAKYRTELKLMTEQINPHFLYNTLEEIQSEVLRRCNDTAAAMIQYLADYLRISLSGGADVISITNELRHVNAYIKIMNQRFGQSIQFVHRISPALTDGHILKTILQPLVENTIRHGFGIDAAGMPVSVPTIEISFDADGTDGMQITVSDNGSGFDAASVLQIMTADQTSDPLAHVGVNNVYHRLITYYGKENVHVTASSIPYYQNTICIRIAHAAHAANTL